MTTVFRSKEAFPQDIFFAWAEMLINQAERSCSKNHLVWYKFVSWIWLGGHGMLNTHCSSNENTSEKVRKLLHRWDFRIFPQVMDGEAETLL